MMETKRETFDEMQARLRKDIVKFVDSTEKKSGKKAANYVKKKFDVDSWNK
ncbi:hypothetical protein [Paenibacillus xylanexedens]|uniref:hypothetical protein n=1 Tax=Paenibacillus xylanexedens TaxID=528191 RepID=UPI0016425E30|nr:hypothetical protein [Paenibacillus xylanexedens]